MSTRGRMGRENVLSVPQDTIRPETRVAGKDEGHVTGVRRPGRVNPRGRGGRRGLRGPAFTPGVTATSF